ncbi:MAG: hypothetical protein O9293_11690 [Porphyrobacter sp.]|nr:hypothetical protein [Porphyrobacter sp.]
MPELWRGKFSEIAAGLAIGDYQLETSPIDGLEPIDAITAASIAENVVAYGDRLTALSDATWSRSVCRWMGDYWQVLVDLSTTSEQASDLTLHAKVFDADCSRFGIVSVHVP